MDNQKNWEEKQRQKKKKIEAKRALLSDVDLKNIDARSILDFIPAPPKDPAPKKIGKMFLPPEEEKDLPFSGT